MTEWISVAERLPEKESWCWIKCATDADPAIFPAKFIKKYGGDIGWTNEDCWEDFFDEVTHWAALPDPPK